ncbi:hypothetical protein NDU88_001963 [Pleurodeles waltl]|uniref:Uncharacterized protein n=1 Tax=Pleurodeles waltl TaxID=8319 RepID=A0AAV7UAX9_PLEWA|nr:hypothetical protein NDU88_001963 [Pleurodeles waltl]
MKWKMVNMLENQRLYANPEVEQEVSRLSRLACEMMLQQIKLDREHDEKEAPTCCFQLFRGQSRKERYRAASRERYEQPAESATSSQQRLVRVKSSQAEDTTARHPAQ